MRWAGLVAGIRGIRDAYKIVVGNLKGSDHLGEINIDEMIILKRILREIGCEDVGWIHLTQDRDQLRAVVNTVMNLRGP